MINPPDLTKVLTAEDFDNIQNIIDAGKVSEYFNLGDELKVTYGQVVMPFEVVGWEDVEIEGGQIVPALNLLAKYTNDSPTQYGSSRDVVYSASTLRGVITGEYQGYLDNDFVACLGSTKVQTVNRGSGVDIVYDKLFAPSMAQLGVTNIEFNDTAQAAAEGPVFTAYVGAADAKRVRCKITSTSTGSSYWTRSCYWSVRRFFGVILDSGHPHAYNYRGAGDSVAVCNLIGKGA